MSRFILALALVAGTAGCGNNGSGNGSMDMSAGGSNDMPMMQSMTIAQALGSHLTSAFTTTAYVTGVRKNSMATKFDVYIEDPAGGMNSGIDVFCDHGAKTPCPSSITPPTVGQMVTITGTISAFDGKEEMKPTSMTVSSMTGTAPPIPTVMMSDVAPTAMSAYRGVLVKLANVVTVDNVTPMALYDTNCAGDAGVNGLCTSCGPPSYSGFEAADGSGNKVLIEQFFYGSENLQSSPECLTQKNAVPVTNGMTFSMVTGILDFDTYGKVQVLQPVTDSDYTTP